MTALPDDRDDSLVYQQQVARLQALLEASRRVHGALQLDDVLQSALEIAVKETEADGAFFTPGEAIHGAHLTTYGNVPAQLLVHPFEHPDNWSADVHFPLRDKAGNLLTTLVVIRPGAPLSLEETDFLEGLALQAAVAVDTARQHERMIEWERVQRDLASARAIQRSLMPHDVPAIPGYSVDYRSLACYEVGGDYVDILQLPDGRYLMLVADVAGKGLASAMVSGSFRAGFRALAAAGLPLEELAARMNNLHHSDGIEARRRYVTAILVRLDSVANTFEFVNAGHNPGFLVADGGCSALLESSGPPLGMLPGMTYTAAQHFIPAGGRVLLYTDGLIEVFRGDEEFGEERLLDGFRQAPATPAGNILDALWAQLNDFADSESQSDDMTALAIIRDGPVVRHHQRGAANG
jgi:serine phosphatase RsbU (regulator of sigma subunit)